MVTKRVVLKEVIRIRKVVVKEEEVVEVDLRKEEVDIEDTNGRTASRDASRGTDPDRTGRRER